MTSIVKANEKDIQLLVQIGKQSFIESHGRSAPETDIIAYIKKKFSDDALKEELRETANIYHIIYFNKQPAGYSKIIFNHPHINIRQQRITKLERLYLLKDFYNLKLGVELLQFNTELSKEEDEEGMWLFVWKENQRAVQFYTKAGFQVIGSYNFSISETHANPNHQMFLKY